MKPFYITCGAMLGLVVSTFAAAPTADQIEVQVSYCEMNHTGVLGTKPVAFPVIKIASGQTGESESGHIRCAVTAAINKPGEVTLTAKVTDYRMNKTGKATQ